MRAKRALCHYIPENDPPNGPPPHSSDSVVPTKASRSSSVSLTSDKNLIAENNVSCESIVSDCQKSDDDFVSYNNSDKEGSYSNVFNEGSSSYSHSSVSGDIGDFKSKLVHWALHHNVTHNALNDLLHLLQHPVPADLPLDARTLLGTARELSFKEVAPGIYYHFGLQICLENLFLYVEDTLKSNVIEININVDGLPLSKCSSSQVYPILCNIVGCSLVEMVGIYHGYEKPKDANVFLNDFVSDAISVINNGVFINGKLYRVKIKAFVCDAPAKSFIKYIKSHTGYSSCTKCYIGYRVPCATGLLIRMKNYKMLCENARN